MQILYRFFDAVPVRQHVVDKLKTVEKWATPAALSVYRRQGGLRLSDIANPAITALVRRLEYVVGLRCDLYKCSAREQLPTGTQTLGWHQDHAGMDLDGGVGKVAWVPLDPLDGTRPSLEIAPVEHPQPHIRDERRFLVFADTRERSGTFVVTGLEPDDVVVFSPYAPHRTYCRPEMTNTRLSLDLRFQ